MADFVAAADALEVAQVRAAAVTAYHASTTYSITINGKVVSVVGSGGSTTTVAAALKAALNADTVPAEFQEVTWDNSTNTLIGTMDTPGKPFTFSTSVAGGSGTIDAAADTTANDGPEAITAKNFKNASTGARALPSNGDTLTIEALDTDLHYELGALSAVTLAALYIEASFTGQLGLPPRNEDGDDAYDEYRAQYFAVGATLCVIGQGEGDGSDLLMLDFGSVQTALRIVKTASDGEIEGLAPVIWKGTHASNTVTVESGSVEIAPFAGEVATIATLTAIGDSTVTTWAGVTLTTVNAGGGATIDITSAAGLSDITTINIYDSATVILRGDNPATTVNVHGPNATFDLRSSGTIGTCNLIESANLDLSANPSSVTITTLTGSGEPTINDPNSRLTVTNEVDPKNSDIFEWDWNLKPGRKFTLGSP